MRRRFAPFGIVAISVLGLAACTGTATVGAGGKSANAKLCQKDGWTTLYRADSTPFANQAECESYAKRGGEFGDPPSSNTGTGVFNGEFLAGNPAALEPTLPTVGDCYTPNAPSLTPYQTYTVTLAAPATLDILAEGEQTFGSGSGYLRLPDLALYAGAFDPADTCGTNLLATNNVAIPSPGLNSGIHYEAGAGTYTVVVWTWYTQFFGGVGWEIGNYRLTITAS